MAIVTSARPKTRLTLTEYVRCRNGVPLGAEGGLEERPLRDTKTEQVLPAEGVRWLVDPLSAEGLTNWEVAERLVISIATVKKHNENICGIPQVRSRTEAAARARELGLL